jgi:hypothetical protein
METTHQIESHLKANANMSKKDIIIGNFLGGLAWGFGTVVGATLVVAIIIYSLKAVGAFDFVKSLVPDSPINRTLPQLTE